MMCLNGRQYLCKEVLYVYDKVPDCAEVVHCWISSVSSWSDGLADIHLAEGCEETMVKASHLVWPGIGANSLNHCNIVIWNTYPVPHSFNHTIRRIIFHLCVTSLKMLLCHWFLFFSSKLEGIAKEQILVLVTASITSWAAFFIWGLCFEHRVCSLNAQQVLH